MEHPCLCRRWAGLEHIQVRLVDQNEGASTGVLTAVFSRLDLRILLSLRRTQRQRQTHPESSLLLCLMINA
jgi:hypothetical protein